MSRLQRDETARKVCHESAGPDKVRTPSSLLGVGCQSVTETRSVGGKFVAGIVAGVAVAVAVARNEERPRRNLGSTTLIVLEGEYRIGWLAVDIDSIARRAGRPRADSPATIPSNVQRSIAVRLPAEQLAYLSGPVAGIVAVASKWVIVESSSTPIRVDSNGSDQQDCLFPPSCLCPR